MSQSSLSTYNPPSLFRPTYEALLGRALSTECRETNARTGHTIRQIGPVAFTLDLSSGKLPVCGIRKTWAKTAAAEVAWFLQGLQDVTWLKQYAPVWNDFVEEDGTTVRGAYGFRWREAFGRDQIGDAILALTRNPSDRRIFVSAWDPASDGLGAQGQKNVPCPVGFTLSIRDGQLDSTLLIRSSDVFVGLPYDVMGHALLMDAIGATLHEAGVVDGLGTMQVCLAHPHLYEVHAVMAWEALGSRPSDDTIHMPGWTVSQILYQPDGYVGAIRELSRFIRQPEYSCKPEVVK